MYRVLHICQSFYNPLYALQFDQLIEQEIDCEVFYFTNQENKEQAIAREYMKEVRPYKNLDRFFFFHKENKVFRSFERHIKENAPPSLVHAHTLFSSGYIAYKAFKKMGIPYVITVRNVDTEHFFKKRVYLRGVGRKILKNAQSVIFISKSAMESTLRFLPKAQHERLVKKSYIIPNGINDFWIQRRVVHERKENSLRILYFGDLNKNKNVTTTATALESMISKGYDLRFCVIGKLKDASLTSVTQKPFVDYYEYMNKEELIEKIRENDIFVMPSFSETFGLSYVEAMSQGLPVVYTKGQGFDGLFEEGEVGYRVDPRSTEEIERAILDIVKNYEAMSVRAMEAAATFSWASTARKIKSVYLKDGEIGR